MLYFTSDIHFCDPVTFKDDSRPFNNITEYDNYIVKNYNKIVDKNDTLYVIGDLMDCSNPSSPYWKDAARYIKKIKANIILIIGNNEQRVIDFFFDSNFDKFKEYCLSIGIKDVKKDDYLSFGGYNFYLTHKPINHKKEYTNLFGHLHRSRGLWQSFGINVSCDINHYRPYSEDDILFQLSQKETYWDYDQNLKLL